MIRPSQKNDAFTLAQLHIARLSTGFLSELGVGLLSMVYRYLIRYQRVWVYEDQGQVVGFVSLSVDGQSMMKQFILRYPWFLVRFLLFSLRHPLLLFKAIETFRAPAKTASGSMEAKMPNLHLPELLSIAVSNQVQTKGIGTALLKPLEAFLKEQGYSSYKVVAGEELVSANRFYQKNGFTLAFQTAIHGAAKSNVYIKHI